MNVLSCCILILLLLISSSPVLATEPGSFVVVTRTTSPISLVTTTTTPVPYGALSVSSVPSGATVIIDGATAGTTPYTVRTLPEGTHSLTVRMTGYADVSDSVMITRDSRLEKSYTLLPLTPAPPAVSTGLLSVESSPSGATVILDGVTRGTTPQFRLEVPTGSHTLVLQKAGYRDVADSVTIRVDFPVEMTYTLVPVTAAATTIQTTVPVQTTIALQATAPVTAAATVVTTGTPASTVTTAKTTPARPGPPGSVFNEKRVSAMKLNGTFTVRPYTITAGGRTKQPILTTSSPYFRHQFEAADDSGLHINPEDIILPPNTILEVDENTVITHNYLTGHVNPETCTHVHQCPIWSDSALFLITSDDSTYDRAHFRWISDDEDVTAAFYQVSRYPFPADNVHWQNQYVPGLVGSGPAPDLETDAAGNHYFDLNFALFANHRPGDPPIYTGVIYLDNPVGGTGEPLDLVQIPLTSIGITMKQFIVGPLKAGIPAGIVTVPEDAVLESELGYPNEGMFSVSTGIDRAALASAFEDLFMEMDHTYYVRVIPIRGNGQAGIPTYPVEVTVKRPQPCPPVPPPDTTSTVTVRPPSTKVVSFYLQAFVRNDWLHTDQNGNLVSRARYLSVTAPPGCDPAVEVQKPLMQQDPVCMQYIGRTGGGQPNYHFYIDPPEGSWYDTFFEVIKGLFGAFTSVINSVSAAWSNIQAMAVQVVASVVQVITLNTIKCGESAACKGVLQTGLSVAMTSLGVPPTIPNFAELQSMGTGYLAKVAAEELGAGEVYEALPDNVKNEMIGKANEIGNEMAGELTATTAGITADAAGSWYIPDPLYYQPHPAFVIVKVYNPNPMKTDPVMMDVWDTWRLYEITDPVIIPSLGPGESVSVPVVLTERYTDVWKPGCDQTSYYTLCGEDACIPCFWNEWYFKAMEYSETKGPDQFVANLYTTIPNTYTQEHGFRTPLTPTSSGTVLGTESHTTYDDLGNMCTPTHTHTILKYPDGWVITRDPFSQDLTNVIWGKYTFTNGNHGLLIGT